MLSGSVPFSAKTYEGLVEANMRCKIDFNFDKNKFKISDDALDLLKKMLDPNPDNRPTAIECLNHPVFKSHKPIGLTVDTNLKGVGNLGIEGPTGNLKKTELHQTDIPDTLEELNSPVASPLIRRVSKNQEGFSLNIQQMS